MKPLAYPKTVRLLRRRDFDRVFAGGRPFRDARLTLHVLANGRAESRLGIVVGRKVKTAIVRNRIKRWVREAFRRRRAELPAGFDLVVLPRAPRELDAGTVEESLVKLGAACARALARREPPAAPPPPPPPSGKQGA
ncbi:MAG: ribonuclease P protein component [Planctomycetes bacterium]|nr:ribonuclease P protein component [Planctomycetota bacterium]